MPVSINGSCLCGGVAFEVVGKTSEIGQCHCSKCRKVSGTTGNAVFYVAAQNLRWLRGMDLIKSYVVSEESGWTSTFCGRCGSPVPHTDKNNKFYFVPAGLLDDDPGHRGFAAHIYVGSIAPWIMITDDAPQYVEGFDSPPMRTGR